MDKLESKDAEYYKSLGTIRKFIICGGYSSYENYLFLKYNGHLQELAHEFFVGEHFLEDPYELFVLLGWGQPFADLPEHLKKFIKEKKLLEEIKKSFSEYQETDYIPVGAMQIIIKAVQEDMILYQKQNPSIFSVFFYAHIKLEPHDNNKFTIAWFDRFTGRSSKQITLLMDKHVLQLPFFNHVNQTYLMLRISP